MVARIMLFSRCPSLCVLGRHGSLDLPRVQVRLQRMPGSRQSDGVGSLEFEDLETDVSKTVLVDGMEDVSSTLGARRNYGGGRTAHATAGESVGIIGSSHDVVTRFSSINSWDESSRARMSYLDAVLSAPARAPAATLVARCSAPSSAAVGLCMHDDGSSMHGACSNSCSDNSGGTGGPLPVQRSTSYCLDNSWSDRVRFQGPTGRTCTKGGVSAGRRCTGAGCRFTSQEATRHRYQAG